MSGANVPSGPGGAGRRRRSPAGLVGLALAGALLVNLPLAHGAWTDRRVERDGVDVAARLTGSERRGDGDDATYRVGFALPEEVDPAGATWYAVVDAEAYEAAEETGRLPVRVLPDQPSRHRVEGEVRGRLLLTVTLVADLVLLAMVLLARRHRRGRPDEPRLVATADVERAAPGGLLERLDEHRWVAVGEVEELGDGTLVLDLGPRRVHVDLAGHANPVGYQQTARVTGVWTDGARAD